jgi:hypothetical protein
MLAASPSYAEDCNAAGTVGSGGSAAAGGTSASTLGTAGACVTDDGTTSSIGSAGSAASADGKAKTRTKVMDNDQQLKAQSKAQAMDQGTFSKSQTKTRVNGDELDSDTRDDVARAWPKAESKARPKQRHSSGRMRGWRQSTIGSAPGPVR